MCIETVFVFSFCVRACIPKPLSAITGQAYRQMQSRALKSEKSGKLLKGLFPDSCTEITHNDIDMHIGLDTLEIQMPDDQFFMCG